MPENQCRSEVSVQNVNLAESQPPQALSPFPQQHIVTAETATIANVRP